MAANLDLRLVWRGLLRARALAAAAVLALASGIAGTTIMFALVRGVLLRPLPVHEPDRLVVAWKELRSSGFAHYPFGDPEIDTVAEASQLLADVAGVTANGVSREVVLEQGEASYVNVALVTGRFFNVLAAKPVAGRMLNQHDDVDGAERVAVISAGLWWRRYGGYPDAIGRTVILREAPFTIVGVVPSDLDYPRGVEVWTTTKSIAAGGPFGDAARREIDLIARLKPGVSLGQARSELAALTERFESTAPRNMPRGLVAVVQPFEEVVVGDARRPLLALFAAVAVVLLIAVANVANLLLMRAESRASELALLEAIGAGRGRIVRYIFAESVLLTLPAAFVGLVAAWWALPALRSLVPQGLPRVASVRIDGVVALFTVAVACVMAFFVGLVPAWASSRGDLLARVRRIDRGVTGSFGRHPRRALVVAQVALALTVVIAAGLLASTLRNLQSVDLGIPASRLVLVDLAVPEAKYTDRARHAQFLEDVLSKFEAAPSIDAATPVNIPPFSGEAGWDVPAFTAEGQSAERAASNPALNLESVHPNYFEAFQVRIVRGRSFTRADREGALPTAIVSDDVAARTWPGQDPIGKRLKLGGTDSTAEWRTIVGVTASTRYREVAKARPTLYLPAAQFLMTARMLALRTAAPIALVASLARDRVHAVDPDARVVRVAPFPELLAAPLARPRLNAFLSSVFGFAALLLSAIGLYAVLEAYVRMRDREIAIRVALGANPQDVRALVLGEALRLAGYGMAIGIALAAGTSSGLRGLLFGIDPLDVRTAFSAALALLAVSALAAYVPVRRATRLDPAAMLRT